MDLYTDGCCLGNPGKGGYGIIVTKEDNTIMSIGDFKPMTTNNEMELLAVDVALSVVIANSDNCIIYTDSTYVLNGCTKWLEKWSSNNWTTSNGFPVKNSAIWKRIHNKIKKISNRVTFQKVKAHSGNEYNEKVDALAKEMANLNE